MRKVIDANYFQSPDLRRYLEASKANIAVLPDIAGMEAYKGDPVRNLELSYEILQRFPRQVLILRGTRIIIKTAADTKNHTRWMVDKEQTAGFAKFYRQIKVAAGGDEPHIRAVQRTAMDAIDHFDRVRRRYRFAQCIRGNGVNLYRGRPAATAIGPRPCNRSATKQSCPSNAVGVR